MRASSLTIQALRAHGRRARTRRRGRARARALTKLVEQRLPLEFEVTGDHDAWPLVAAALQSRMTTTMQSILALQSRNQAVDAGTLLRSLFEHVVHLAWLAADPSPARLEEWRKHDLRERQKAANDAALRGIELYSAQDRTALDAQLAALTGNKLVLQVLAQQADAYWAGKLPGMGAASRLARSVACTRFSTATTAGRRIRHSGD